MGKTQEASFDRPIDRIAHAAIRGGIAHRRMAKPPPNLE